MGKRYRDDNYKMTDSNVIEYIKEYKAKHKKFYIKCIDKEIIEYLKFRYSDSLSIQESIYRLLNNIEIRPKCKCGNNLSFNNINKGFYHHCSISCAQSDPTILSKIKNTKIKKYGSANNIEKIKKTCLERYGVEFLLQLKDKQEKAKQTCLERYGNKNYRNIEQSIKTCLDKYGTEYYFNSDDCKEKTINKLGVDNYRKTDDCKQKVSKYIKEHKNEIENKKKQTYIKNYGVDNPMKSNIIKKKFNWKTQKEKEYKTKKKNHSFNTSKIENESYKLLKEKFTDVIYQYKSNVYPFVCDFYIPNLDLYIECNYHWTHGGHPYNELDKKDNLILEKWKNKNTEYYNNAITTWTKRDVEKRKIAKENKLNYIEFYTILNLIKWLKTHK